MAVTAPKKRLHIGGSDHAQVTQDPNREEIRTVRAQHRPPTSEANHAATAAAKAVLQRAPQMHSPALPARPSKKAAIVALLERPNGAAIGDLTEATGWQTHSVRAALTGLRKEGKELVRDKDAAGVTHYRLAAA